jgi:hypothetical protein
VTGLLCVAFLVNACIGLRHWRANLAPVSPGGQSM